MSPVGEVSDLATGSAEGSNIVMGTAEGSLGVVTGTATLSCSREGSPQIFLAHLGK